MALMIKEFIDHDGVPFFCEAANDVSNTNKTLSEAEKNNAIQINPNSLMVEIEALHAYPYATRNFTRYMPESLIDSIPTWTKPYNRPLIQHHNTKDGKIIGRVLNAYYIEKSNRSKTPALGLIVNIPDEDAKQAIKDGRLDTVSVGLMANDVRCSICGHHLSDGDMCEHKRGHTYDVDGVSKICYWDIYSWEAKEASYVVVPSDIYAGNSGISVAGSQPLSHEITESLDENISQEGVDIMASTDKELTEAKAKISELETKIKQLEESAASAKDLEDKNNALTVKVKELEEAAKESADLKEGLESELTDTKVKLKESMIQTLQVMRKALDKPELTADKIKDRTEESIRDSILDLEEEFNLLQSKVDAKEDSSNKDIKENADLPKPNSITDPSVHDTDKDMHIKESADNEKKLDLKAGFENLFSSVMGIRK